MLDKTTSTITSTLNSNVNLINQIKSVVPLSKGKKVRSTLLFLLGGAANGLSDELPVIASSIELFHLSSLIHDDILDNAALRRGDKTLNNELGNLISVLGGDFLFVHSLNLMNNIRKPALMDILLEATQIMVEGQLQEIENNFNYNVRLETYLEVIEKKTSSLFGAVSQMAAVVNNKDSRTKREFQEFGMNFGNIFQITDDLIDIFSTSSGKDRFRDLQEGKITLPFILLQDAAEGMDVTEFFSVEHSEKLLELFERYKIKDRSHDKVDEYYNNCIKFLNRFPPSEYKDSLKDLLDFIRYREY
ncbi:MAG: polyprenyl synthetase family protein [Acidobacteriota bacterium]